MRSTRIFQAVPVLQVADVAASARWYRNVLGFDADPFPAKPPYQFAILRHGDTELMLQKAAVPVSSALPLGCLSKARRRQDSKPLSRSLGNVSRRRRTYPATA